MLATLLPASANGTSTVGTLVTRIVFPTGRPAAGAEVRLAAQPEPIWPATPAGEVEYPNEVEWATAVADADGRVEFDLPEAAELVALAHQQGGRLRAVLSYTAYEGSEELPAYYRV